MNQEILDEEIKDIDLHKNNLTNRFGIFLAKYSFIFGTLLFCSGCIFRHNDGIVILGFFFTVIAFIMNLMFFLFLCIKSGTSEEQESYRKTAAIMALNIPIALIYFKIISQQI